MRTHFSFRLTDCTSPWPVLLTSAGHAAPDTGKLTGHSPDSLSGINTWSGIKNHVIYFMSRVRSLNYKVSKGHIHSDQRLNILKDDA